VSVLKGQNDLLKAMTRRYFFRRGGLGIGGIALSSLFNEKLFAGTTQPDLSMSNPLAPRQPHFAPKARSIIYLFMAGAPSQVDLLDPKPKLKEFNGQRIPEEMIKGDRFVFIRGIPKLLGSPYTFKRYGQSGTEVSNLLPHLSEVVDDIAVVRSAQTGEINHGPAQIFMNSGHPMIGRPSMGSWLTYGLGSESSDLPAFVVLISGEGHPDGGKSCWSCGFLPSVYQGVEFRAKGGDPVLFVSNPEGVSAEARRDSLDLLRQLNERHLVDVGDPEVATRIASFETAYRMQTSVPELTDVSTEPRDIHEMYGTEPGKASFANNCLLARRLVERGVRFVQLYHRGWDHHGGEGGDIRTGLPRLCQQTDHAAAALVKDLKQRGLLDSTLVIWGGEFGRTPMEQGENSQYPGRDHHIKAFTLWMAGAGVKRGITLGQTDELGYNAVEDPIDVHDLHATILHLMGLDHSRLIYRFQGREFRLTDVHGNVVKKLLT
jgi:Protein of unknown function (DUF1501)